MTKIGILAGTFDPVHAGHLAFAQAAITECGLDRIFFLAEPSPRRKQGVKSLQHRTEMVQLALAQHDQFGTIILNQTQFSVEETLPVLQARFAGARLYMLLGEDVLGHLTSWPHVRQLIESVEFVIGVRTQTHAKAVNDLIKNIEETRGLSFKHHIITSEIPGVSSSKVRMRLRRGQVPAGVPQSVLEYIRAHQLYSPTTDEY